MKAAINKKRRAIMFSALGRVVFALGLTFVTWQPITSQDSFVVIPGDVTIAAMFRVNHLQEGQCGRYDVNSLQELMAVTWFVEALNGMSYIHDVTIGLEVYRTCKMPEMAARGVVELLNKYHVGKEDSQTTPVLFGIVGPDRTSEALSTSNLIGSLPTSQRLLQISGSATGEQLSDKKLHPSFFRVIPPDNIQTQIMLQLLLQLQWNYVAIVYADDDYGRSAATELRRLAEGKKLCVPVFASLPLDTGSSAFATQASSIAHQLKSEDNGLVRGVVILASRSTTQQLLPVLQEQAKFVQLVLSEAVGLQTATLLTPTSQTVSFGALVTSPPYLDVPEFTPFWNELWTNRTMFDVYSDRNPWIRGYFDQITNCETGVDCWNEKASVRNEQTIPVGESSQAELSLYTGYQVKATAVMAALLKHLHDIKCGSSSSGFCPELRSTIAQREALQNILQGNPFSFDDMAPVSQALANMSAVRFNASGDVTLLEGNNGYGVYNLKKTASGDFAFQRNVLVGRRVGLVGICSCSSSLLVRRRLMDFYSGRLRLPGGRNSSSLLGQLMGVVGAFYSSNSIAVSDTLTTLGTPFVQVSAASTNPDLKDRNRYPYFMRLVPSDDKQAQVMLDIIQSLGASYIQVMYDSSTAYATALYHALQKKVVDSKKYNVCIAQSIPITPHDTVSQYVYIMDTLRIKSSAKVVIVLLHTVEISKVMDAILRLLTSEDDFLFLASESWGRRQKIIEGRVKLEGSLVLAQEIAVDKLFERYFAELDLADSMNPWLKSFWEARLNCYMDKSFHRKGKTGPCPERFAESYVQDSRVPFHIQAVYALVKGFDAALTQHCGSPATHTCESLTSSRLVSAMHEVELDLYSTGQFSPVFDKNGDGLVGYHVLKISRNLETPEDDVVYKDVGRWTEEGLNLEREELRVVSSVCPNSAECDICFGVHTSSTPPNSRPDTTDSGGKGQNDASVEGVPLPVTAGVGAVFVVIIIFLVVAIICLVRRRQSSPGLRRSNIITAPKEEGRSNISEETSQYTTPDELDLSREVHMLALPPQPCFKQQVHDYLTATAEMDHVEMSTARTNPAYDSSTLE